MSPEPRTPVDRASPLLRQRIRAVFKELPKGLAGDEEAIHQMRVAGRRLRAALPLLAKKPDGKRVRRARHALRELTRAAGASRDLDVSLELFEAHVETLATLSPEQRGIRRRLRAARTRSRTRMAEALMDLEIARLRRDLRRILARKGSDLFSVLGRLRTSRDQRGDALLAGFAELGERYDPEALHMLRRRARRLRYMAEVQDLLVRDEPSEASGLLKSLQAQIGDLHDAYVLARWLEAQARTALARGRSGDAQAAFAFQAAFEARGHELHQQLMESGPGETVSRALAAMGRSRTAA